MCTTRQGSMHRFRRLRFTRAWLAIRCGRLHLRASLPGRRCQTGRHRRGGERPPSPRAWYGFGRRCVFTPLPPSLGVAPATAASSGSASPLRRPWCNRNAASDMRKRRRAHGSGVFVHMHPDVDVHARHATDARRPGVKIRPRQAGSNAMPRTRRSSFRGARNGASPSARRSSPPQGRV